MVETGSGNRSDSKAVKSRVRRRRAQAPVVQPCRNGPFAAVPSADLSKTGGDDYLVASRRMAPCVLVDDMIDSALLGLPDFAGGQVWLVGAGPGDPGLLSVWRCMLSPTPMSSSTTRSLTRASCVWPGRARCSISLVNAAADRHRTSPTSRGG